MSDLENGRTVLLTPEQRANIDQAIISSYFNSDEEIIADQVRLIGNLAITAMLTVEERIRSGETQLPPLNPESIVQAIGTKIPPHSWLSYMSDAKYQNRRKSFERDLGRYYH